MDIKEILETIALPARSGKKGFKVTDKLEAVEKLVGENSNYVCVHKSAQSWMFGKKEPVAGTQAMLVSTHSDIVDSITEPFSEYVEEECYFKGTYDNLGTNAACVYLMLHGNLPDNVYFAFTADEETGRCNGANDALHYIETSTYLAPSIVLALDVTEEGYDNDRLFTVEGLHGRNEDIRRNILNLFLKTEGQEQSFEVVRLSKNDDNSFLPPKYNSKEITMYDESVFYAKKNCNSCSICLPGDGSMHSNSGFYVKEAVMKGYCLSLEALILIASKTNPSRIEEIKTLKDELVQNAKETAFHKFYNTNYVSYWATETEEYRGGGLGQYWVNKNKQKNDQIPGQITLADICDEFSDHNYSIYDAIEGIDEDEMYEELYDFAGGYGIDEFDMFVSDVLYTYGIKYDMDEEEDLLNYLMEIFSEYHGGYISELEEGYYDEFY